MALAEDARQTAGDPRPGLPPVPDSARLEAEAHDRSWIPPRRARLFEGNDTAFDAGWTGSFWLADNLALQGRHDEARALFDRLLAVRNDVGLLAEEYEPRTRRLLGNFPQAMSHMALIDTAANLTRARGPAHDRTGS
jgi:hypothetical protein